VAPEPAVDPPEPIDEALWLAVARLPTKQRVAVLQRYVADLAYAEIAEILECSEAAARQNVRAGLVSLRSHLDKEPQP
jgi:RNA polymerase sigma factor (sigma-70 family)